MIEEKLNLSELNLTLWLQKGYLMSMFGDDSANQVRYLAMPKMHRISAAFLSSTQAILTYTIPRGKKQLYAVVLNITGRCITFGTILKVNDKPENPIYVEGDDE